MLRTLRIGSRLEKTSDDKNKEIMKFGLESLLELLELLVASGVIGTGPSFPY